MTYRLLFFTLFFTQLTFAQTTEKPQLIVGIVVDQMRMENIPSLVMLLKDKKSLIKSLKMTPSKTSVSNASVRKPKAGMQQQHSIVLY